jgi:Ring hydroxylating alpha subunit (catalytic domain)
MSSFRTCPGTEPGWSRMEFDYYHSGTEAEFEEYFKFVRQVALEDFELCEKAQQGLEGGVYGEGVLNPVKENGVLFYQRRVRESVYRQFELEKKVKEEQREKEAGGEGMQGLGEGKNGVVAVQ